MHAGRRKEVNKLQDRITAFRDTHAEVLLAMVTELTTICDDLGTIRDELQDKFDGMSEKSQEGKSGDAIAEEISQLETAIGSIEEVHAMIDEDEMSFLFDTAFEAMEEAKGMQDA